ncbi:hypothetical protein SNK03_004330 [Fusarium graminearum]|nr:hypothetical protein FGSG_08112 [Fusarium graminearum PH-1]ESU15282.1 hypothetical protein FGSG_08112 [Fusarium graminearum PH-1]KAI6753657.1 hypothetical protein HG531_005826 [Fusarium graminearum]CAF3558342.1 unnamed protein product [Fusarium graminearum]|eukprot:XP_011320707.1 hypothetical protein FGSG_08112 [Fusarium graminearum PH-1]
MPVLEVKNWFKNISNSSADELVLGQYPLEFFQEAAKQIGASVFDMLSCTSASLQNGLSATSVGSLLPFTPVSRQGFDSPATDISSRQIFPGFLREEEYKLSPEVQVKIGQWTMDTNS